MNIFSLYYTVSEDLTVLLQMVRKLQHQSTLVRIQKADHYNLESLCRLYDQWMADGANLKKAKKYTNVVHSPLLAGNKNKKILELINIAGLLYC